MITFDEFIKQNKNDIQNDSMLLIVCNAKEKTLIRGNYSNFSIDTEFLSNDELLEISNMARELNYPFRIFYDEKDFICEISSIADSQINKFIVYNSAQNGIGPGRKALIPSICNFLGVRYTGSDPYRVCLCRDKFAINSILCANKISAPKSFLYYGNIVPKLENDKIYIAKPLYESSSLGITDKNIFSGNSFPKKYLDILINHMQQPLLLQEFIEGYELEVPVLVSKKSTFVFSPVVLHQNKEDLSMDKNILDYQKIYNDEYYFSTLPNYISEEPIKNTAMRVASLLGLKGLCRVDFRMKRDNSFYVTDVSTNPHFINHSSVNFAFMQLGKQNKDILNTILLLS